VYDLATNASAARMASAAAADHGGLGASGGLGAGGGDIVGDPEAFVDPAQLRWQEQERQRKEKRAALVAKLPAIGSDEKTRRFLMTKLKDKLVQTHTELDRVKQKGAARRKRLKELKAQLRDLRRDVAGQLGGGGAKGRGRRGAAAGGGVKNPHMLRLSAQLAQHDIRMEDLREERLSMERMRERMENDWVVSVARLRDKRAILQQHDHSDEALSKDYLCQCKADKSRALSELANLKRVVKDERRDRKLQLSDMRMEVVSKTIST
jgi:hypothetical protein